MTKKTYSQYDEIANVYDSLFQDKASLKENNEVGAMLSPLNGSVYDIGCGTGLLVELLEISPSNYRGIDPSEGMLEMFISKHPEYKDCVHNVKCEDDDILLDDYDNIVALFGSASYLSEEDICEIASSSSNKFLMFYKYEYHPVTYERTNVEFEHYVYDEDWLNFMFQDCDIKSFNNYIIVKSYG